MKVESGRAAGAGLRPLDRVFGVYMLVSGAALAFPYRPSGWLLLAVLHLVAAAAALRVGPAGTLVRGVGRRWPRAAGLIHDWYPLILIPALYGELAVLNRAVFDGRYFDDLILAWEQVLFGGQPSRELAAAFPHLALSELLHAAYLSYYFIIYVPPLVLYLSGRRAEFRQVVFAVMLTFIVHYLFFIYFPVQGPRYLFPAPGGEIAGGAMYRLTHAVLEAGSSQGAAFPSSHVAVGAAQSLLAWRYLPRLFPVIALASLGLSVGAIYGGFHYATDAVAGLVLGLALASAAPAVERALTPRAELSR